MTFGWLVACAHTVVTPPSPLGATRPPMCASVCLSGLPVQVFVLAGGEEHLSATPHSCTLYAHPSPPSHLLMLLYQMLALLSKQPSLCLWGLSWCPGTPATRKRDMTNGQGGPTTVPVCNKKRDIVKEDEDGGDRRWPARRIRDKIKKGWRCDGLLLLCEIVGVRKVVQLAGGDLFTVHEMW